MSRCRLLILGGFRLLDARGRERPVNSRKARVLLALAGLAGAGGVSRERVAGLLWADNTEARARQSLRQVLSDLRRDVGPLLAAAGQQLVLPPEHCLVDAIEFAGLACDAQPDALERATALYRGPLLDGLYPVDAPGLDDWLQPERQRLEALNRAAFAKLLARSDGSSPESLARIAERAVAFDPADESAWRALMRAHHDAGHPHRALQAFDYCREALRRRLDALPSAETVSLRERIRAQDRSAPGPLDPAEPSGATASGAMPSAVRRSVPRLPVVAVMPFEVLPPAEPALAASLSQELVGALARIAGYSVADGRMLFRDADFTSDRGRTVVDEHRVAFVVTGRLERTVGVAHRLSVWLLDGDGGRHRWSRRVDLDDDSAEARDALIAATVARIEPQIVLGRAGQPADEPADAEDPWPRVREAFAALFAHGWSEHAVETAVAKYRAAVRVAPELAIAHAHMSLVLALGAKMGLVAGAAPLEEARRAADRAIALAPTDSEVLGCAGCAIADLGDPALGETLLERAVEENPDNPQAWAALGACRLSLARVEAGLAALERGVKVGSSDYRRTVWFTLMSRALLQKRRIDEAIEAARSAVRSDVFFYPAWLALAAAQFRAGRHPQATHAIAQALRIRPQLGVEEANPWVGPRTASRLRDVWPAAVDGGGRPPAADTPSRPLTPH